VLVMSFSEPKQNQRDILRRIRHLLDKQLIAPLSASNEEVDILLVSKLDSLSTMSLLLAIEVEFSIEIDLASPSLQGTPSSLDTLYKVVRVHLYSN